MSAASTSTTNDIVIPCLLFGEVRALLGNLDTLPIRVALQVAPTVGSDESPLKVTTTLSTAELWRTVNAALMEHASSVGLSLDERSRTSLQEVLRVSMLAVDDEFVEVSSTVSVAVDGRRLPSVAVIPPVSGG
ncbi:Hypothetical protein, putative [Bodo saltans]|uniref:Uncharacterized protein n=1 Tax=Bodo saltans TaxID=75058 RepID=A0A0S4IMD8_BODSA|nr:Hypothetical protein, putative [Bodo saltans]|eukprot:CUE73363.1 Hypothetical protein, putative [Bodo saltans]